MKRIFISILAAGIMLPAAAQTMSLSEEHRLNLDVLRMLETYEATSTLRNNDDAATFGALFPNGDVMIYNDLLGISASPELSVSDYVRSMRTSANSPVVTLRNVRKKGIEDAGDRWIVTLTFDKEMRYTNKCGAILSSKGYYGTDYNLEARISRDKSTGECVIESITGGIDSALPRLDGDFAILELNDPRDRRVTNNGRPITFNSFDQAFLAAPVNLKFPDDDANMKVRRPDPNCNRLSLTYKPLRWRLKVHYDLSLGNYYSLGTLPSGYTATNSGSEFGLDLGYIFPSKSRFKVGFYFGAGYSTSKVSLTGQGMSFSEYMATDVDGDSYTRYTTVSTMEQSYKINNLVVPLYFDFEYRFHTYVSAFIRLGAKAYINMGSSGQNDGGTVSAYGVYPQYGDLLIDDPAMNGFGSHDLAGVGFAEEPSFSMATVDAFGGLGVRGKIYGPLSVEIGLNYQMGLMDAMTIDEEYHENPVVYTGSAYQVQSMALQLEKMRRNGLRLSLGLILKF